MARLSSPLTIRNGLKWRDGRPRWEPSPASRALGLRGLDLKDLGGQWIAERGLAIAVCDGRHQWAQMLREAHQAGPVGEEARTKLRAVLEALQEPQEPEKKLRRLLTADLIEQARALLDGRDAAEGVSLTRGPRSVELLVDAYFAAVDAGKIKIKPGTRASYWAQRGRFLGKFAGRGVGTIRRMEIFNWYHDELVRDHSLFVANLCLGAVAAWFKYAMNLEWREASPVHAIGQKKAKGRRVFWTLEEERDFVVWCDAHGFEDVADGVTYGCWTGARISDLCAADLEELEGPIWKYTPIKTEKHAQEAWPAIVPQVRARVDRRRAEALQLAVRYANASPLLYDVESLQRHSVKSFYRRFVRARSSALGAGAVPAALAGKKQQDTRDTCITRLWAAKVAFERMWTWTGHSKDSIEEICREHYLSLLEAGQLEMAQQLQAWADQEALALG